jgi:hypothetical protein
VSLPSPLAQGKQSGFDADLAFGKAGEEWLVWLGTPAAKVEVKRERDQWLTTGNVCFEYECRGKPSGIAVTQADWWVHLLTVGDDVRGCFVMPVPRLKAFLRWAYSMEGVSQYNFKRVVGGDDNASKMLLVPIHHLHSVAFTENPF